MALRRKFQQTKLFRALIVLAILSFFIFFPPRFLSDPLRSLFATLSWPFERFLSGAAFTLRDSVDFLTSIGDLKQDNETLERKYLELASENAGLKELAKENDNLRRELGLLPRNKYTLAAAEVIGRGANLGDSLLVINQGSRHGLQKNMPVIVSKGVLVGRVADVFPYSATIVLLSHPTSFVNGMASTSGAKGVIKGEHGLGLLFDIVSQSETLTSGDEVVTSGLDPGMPRGLLIGALQEPGLTADRLYQRASLVSPVKFEDLRYVFVIKDVSTPSEF